MTAPLSTRCSSIKAMGKIASKHPSVRSLIRSCHTPACLRCALYQYCASACPTLILLSPPFWEWASHLSLRTEVSLWCPYDLQALDHILDMLMLFLDLDTSYITSDTLIVLHELLRKYPDKVPQLPLRRLIWSFLSFLKLALLQPSNHRFGGSF